MRLMMMIRKGFETEAADAAPGAEAVARMMEYNKSLQKAGVLLGLDGVFPPSTGARVSYADGTATVTNRPFAEANHEIIEVRQIYERAGFSIVVQKEAVQNAAEGFEEHSNAAAAKA